MDLADLVDIEFWLQSVSLLSVLWLLLWAVMPQGSTMSDVFELIAVIGYYLLYLAVSTGQSVWWRLTGVQKQLLRAETEEGLEKCVHVLSIVARLRFPKVNHPRPWDFISIHKEFAHHRDLLSEHVTLYCVTSTHAYMVETPVDVDVYSSKTSPFMKRAQFDHAMRVMVVPLRHLYRLTDKLGDPNVPVSWINNSGRCGSTLLVQMLETGPGMRCLSEPDVTTNIALLSRSGQINEAQTETMTRACVRYLCRAAPGVSHLAIKVRYTCVTEVDLMQKLFPEFRHVYLYRDLGNVMTSFYTFIHRDLAVRLLERVINGSSLSPIRSRVRSYLSAMIAWADCYDRKELVQVLAQGSFMGYSTAIICSNLAVFKNNLESGKTRGVPTLHYDELIRQPAVVASRLFEHLSIPTSHVEKALTALEKDSQAGDIASNIEHSSADRTSGGQRTSKVRTITAEDIDSMNAALKAMGLPDMTQRLNMPGNLMQEQ